MWLGGRGAALVGTTSSRLKRHVARQVVWSMSTACVEREARMAAVSEEVRKVREAEEAKREWRRSEFSTRTKQVGVKVAPDSRPANVVVVGGGRMGEIRCEHVARSAKARLAGFVDRSPMAAAKLAGRHAGCEAYVSLDDALDAAGCEVDAVWICAPSPAHLDLIRTAAEFGAHVAVEKPVAMSAAEIAEAYDICEHHGVHLACAFQRRSDDAYTAVSDAVADGAVGDPVSIRAVFRDHPGPPASFLADAGGDIFHDLATHDVDFVLDLVKRRLACSKYFVEEGPDDDRVTVAPSLDDSDWFKTHGYRDALTVEHHPDEVWAFGTSSTPELRRAGVFDAATVVLKWRRAQLCATLELSRGSSYGYDQRLEVFGSLGSAVSVENAFDATFSRADTLGLHAGKLVHSFPQRFDRAFANELDVFVDCVRGLAAPKVTRHDALLATLVAEAAKVSAATESVVRLAHGGGGGGGTLALVASP